MAVAAGHFGRRHGGRDRRHELELAVNAERLREDVVQRALDLVPAVAGGLADLDRIGPQDHLLEIALAAGRVRERDDQLLARAGEVGVGRERPVRVPALGQRQLVLDEALLDELLRRRHGDEVLPRVGVAT